jgi:vitamin B12 transporter
VHYLFAALFLIAPPPTTPPVIVTPDPEPVSEDPTAVESVLTPESIPGTSGFDMGELLRHAPGVQLRRMGGVGARQNIVMRGTDSQQSLVLLDGVRLNPALGGGVDLSLLSLDGIERVEVTRGGGSALYGTDAIGGVVRIIPRFPAPGLSARARWQWGFFETRRRNLSLGWGADDGKSGVLVNYTRASSTNNFPFEDTNGQLRTREHAASTRHSALLTGGVKIRPLSEIRAVGNFTLAHNQLPGVEQFPSQSATHDQLRGLGSVIWRERGLGAAGLELKARASMRVHQSHVLDPSPQMPPAADTLATVTGAESDLGLLWLAPGSHLLHLKASVVADFAQVESAVSEKIEPSRVVGSLLAADEWSLLSGDLIVQAMLRVDASERAGAVFVPRLGAAWEAPWTGPFSLAIKAGVGRSWRHPSFDELYFDTGQVVGNPNLSPEDAWSVDGAVSLTAGPVELEVAAFHLRIENLIMFLPTTAFTMKATDAQGARTTGIESRLRLEAFPGLDLELRHSVVDARFRDSGRRLPGRAAQIFGGRVSLERNGLKLWCNVDGMSAFYLDRFEGLEEEGRVFVDLGAEAKIGPLATLTLALRNLTNVQASVDAMQQPLPGFSVLAGVRIKL